MATWNPRANDLFLKALELSSADERRKYLDGACGGDAALRAEVESLLAASARAGRFLESGGPGPDPHLPPTIAQPAITEAPGTTVGPYKLLEQIGEGGFGVVFMAEQLEPVRRKVALKVLKPGMDTRQVVARFEAERQALAIMDHQHIAKVFDGGETASGRPFFVMELVKGVPITDYCDRNQLKPRDRLEMFVSVCHAVQHAHQKGIIHRDLKPSNVLVAVHDGRPVVKVIDFGVAKALGQELTEKTLFTGFAQMIGTPLYMSPEQAGQSGPDVDTRSDIYSLGVLLYELLTGTTPFTRERFKQAAYDEIQRIIREEEPPKPSTRLSESKDLLPSISAQRQTEPEKLAKLVRGELDWIVMKALDKDRNRRYETANGLALDLLRYLGDEAVQACPPSAAYRFRKFARRNRVALTTAAFMALALVLGTVVSTWQAVRATRAEALAQKRLETETEARNDAERARKQEAAQRTIADQRRIEADERRIEADEQRRRAEANFLLARKAVDEMYTEVAERWLHNQPELEPVQRDFINKALRYYEQFAQAKEGNAAVRYEAAFASIRVGAMKTALEQYSESSVAAFSQANSILEALVQEHPREPKYRHTLADVQLAVAIQVLLGGNLDEAEKAARRGIAIFEGLAAEFPGERDYRLTLAGAYLLLSRCVPGAAEQAIRKSIDVLENLVARFPAAPECWQELANGHRHLGGHLRSGRVEEALREFRSALELFLKLEREFPNWRGLQRNLLADAHYQLAETLRTAGRPDEAGDAFRQALDEYARGIIESPGQAYFHRQFASCMRELIALLSAAGQQQEVEKVCRRSVELYEKMTAVFPNLPNWRSRVVDENNRLGDLLRDAGKTAQAEESYRAALVVGEGLASSFPAAYEYRQGWVTAQARFVELLRATDRAPEAELAGNRYR